MKKLLVRPIKANKFQKVLGSSFLKITGWEVEGVIHDLPKCVMILAPHTSNWDFPFILAALYALGIRFYWFGKKENRGSRQNMVRQTVEIIQSREQIIIGVPPEGTRSKAEYWKTGFYHIAHQAQIPIVFAFLDYDRKVGGIGPIMNPTGDIDKDMITIRQFYSGITAKYPSEVGRIAIKPLLENNIPS